MDADDSAVEKAQELGGKELKKRGWKEANLTRSRKEVARKSKSPCLSHKPFGSRQMKGRHARGLRRSFWDLLPKHGKCKRAFVLRIHSRSRSCWPQIENYGNLVNQCVAYQNRDKTKNVYEFGTSKLAVPPQSYV